MAIFTRNGHSEEPPTVGFWRSLGAPFTRESQLAAANKAGPPNQSSLLATGLFGVPPQTDVETGSSIAVPLRELVPELVSPFQRTLTYGRMKNDSTVDVSMRAAKTPILGAEFFMDPYSSDPLDEQVNQFCYDNLFGGMNSPFSYSITDILEMFEDGYSTLEKVYELRQWSSGGAGANTREYTMLKKLGTRPANTITKIDYDDNGGPLQITQQAIRADGQPQEVIIPIEKLIIFTFGRKGGNLTGKSLLRTAYPNWYYKTHFYKMDAVQKERHGLGVPMIQLLAGFTKKDREAAQTLVKNLRTNEEAGVVLPPALKLEFAELHGQLVNILESAHHHNTMILLNVLAQFLLLGIEGKGGGRATGGAHVDVFMKSLKYVANTICEMINIYLIPELVVYNFKTNNFPKLKVRNIGETRDLQMFAAALANLIAQNGITMDDPSEQWLRDILDMPTKTIPRPSAQPTPTVPQPTPNGNTAQPPQKGAVKQNGGQGNVGKPANAPQ